MRAAVLAFFFLSGLSGLLYEVVWIRTAGTVIGVTTYAIGTVVGVYMGGLAAGAWLGGRAADRRSGGALLRLYGALEGGVALSALAVPLLLRASEPVFRTLWNSVGDVPALYAALRILLVGAVLAVPTTLMGATLPVLARYLTSSLEEAARMTGLAYATNTLGGVAGTLAAGFWLVPDLGLAKSTWIAAAINLAIALGSLGLSRRIPGAPPLPTLPAPPPPLLPLAVSALSGFTALAYEVAWTRSLILAVGATVTAFTLVLTAFILGIALGSAIGSIVAPRLKDVPRALAGIQFLVGAVAIVLLPSLGDLPLRLAPRVVELRQHPGALLWAEFGLMSLFVLVPASLLGAVFPLVIRWATRSTEGLARAVGAVYTSNTLGSIAGTLAASFLLVPTVGLSSTIKAAATLNFALAAGLLRRRVLWILPGAGIVLGWLLPAWNPKVMASGAFLYGGSYVRDARRQGEDLGAWLEKDTELVAQYWDAYGLVTVHRQAGGLLTLRVNGKTDASSGPSDRIDMQFVGHLPLLHHPDPRRALLIGLGGGVTLGALERHSSIQQIDCVEISRAVVRGAEHFKPVIGDVLGDPRVHLVIGDGRNAILFGRESYDVIVSQPSHLWISGMATLFTRDFFREASLRLAPGGLFCQWVHSKWLSTEDFRQVLGTFFDVFPHGSLWEVFPGSDYVLLGSLDPIVCRVADLDLRIARSGALEEYVGNGAGLVGHLVSDAAGARRAAAGASRITDDLCTIEYTAPRSLGQETRKEFLDWLDGIRDGAVERTLYPDADGLSARKRQARRYLARAVALHAEGGHQKAFRTLASVKNDLFWDPRTKVFVDSMAEDMLYFAATRIESGDVHAAVSVLVLIPAESSHYAEAQKVLEALVRPGPR